MMENCQLCQAAKELEEVARVRHHSEVPTLAQLLLLATSRQAIPRCPFMKDPERCRMLCSALPPAMGDG